MSARVSLPASALDVVDRIATAHGLTRQQAVIRAIGVLQACEAAAADGLDVGVAEREVLERVIVSGECK